MNRAEVASEGWLSLRLRAMGDRKTNRHYIGMQTHLVAHHLTFPRLARKAPAMRGLKAARRRGSRAQPGSALLLKAGLRSVLLPLLLVILNLSFPGQTSAVQVRHGATLFPSRRIFSEDFMAQRCGFRNVGEACHECATPGRW